MIDRLGEIKRLMELARSKRAIPHLDDKIITSWNGLAISALAKAGQILDQESYIAAAKGAPSFIRAQLYQSDKKQLWRLYRGIPSSADAFTEDYAFLTQGLIDLYEASGEPGWLDRAYTLQQSQNRLFYDRDNGGFFEFTEGQDIVFDRSENRFDGAMPNSN